MHPNNCFKAPRKTAVSLSLVSHMISTKIIIGSLSNKMHRRLKDREPYDINTKPHQVQVEQYHVGAQDEEQYNLSWIGVASILAHRYQSSSRIFGHACETPP